MTGANASNFRRRKKVPPSKGSPAGNKTSAASTTAAAAAKARNNREENGNDEKGDKHKENSPAGKTTTSWIRRGRRACFIFVCVLFGLLLLLLLLLLLFVDLSSPLTMHENFQLLRPFVQNNGEQQKMDAAISRSNAQSPLFVQPDYHVLEILPHDPNAFTQGLTYAKGKLYEGTGMYGQSQLRQVDPLTGRVLSKHSMERKYFGEGIAHYYSRDGEEERLIQLTWREQTGFIYRVRHDMEQSSKSKTTMTSAVSFELEREFKFSTVTKEGWGITYDAQEREFYVSDGSEWLYVWDCDSLEEKRRFQVKIMPRQQQQQKEQQQPRLIRHVNELEWIHVPAAPKQGHRLEKAEQQQQPQQRGYILANVWYQDVLILIDPQSGRIEKTYDFSQLYTDRSETADCFNGIAPADEPGEFYVTGKQWPNMYRIKMFL